MGLAAGVLLVIISIAHIIYGEKKQIPALKDVTHDAIMLGSLRIMILQGGILLLAVGIVQIAVSLGMLSLPGISAYFPIAIVLINFITSLIVATFIHPEIFKITVPQFVIFAVIILLQFLSL